MTDTTHPASTDSPAEGGDKPFAYFQFNVPWGAWEQVIPDAAGRPGVVAAYLRPGVREKVEYLRKSRDGHAANAHAEFEKRVMATNALIAAREALHQHYVDWDGEPEDALPLQEARAECDRVLDALLSSNTGDQQ